MLECVSFKSLTPTTNISSLPPPSHSQSEGNSTEEENTSATSPNVSREFQRAVQAHSYNEIRSMIQAPPQVHHVDDEDSYHRHLLSQVLQPDSHSVREALAKSKPQSNLTRLVSTYFDHSETASDFCLRLSRSVRRARLLYAPLSDLLSVLPDHSLSQPQCDRAFDLFLQFDRHDNPFALSRLHPLRDRFSAAATVVVVVAHSAVGFAAFTAAPPLLCAPRPRRRELARLKQLEAVENGTLVVNDINTIDSLVDRLLTAVEADKAYVRFALERGREKHPIQEVLKQLRKSQPVLEHLLGDLEQHIYFCFYSVNKARFALLNEICLHQTH
ncbi:UPF0496 protein At3g19330 [Cajanus cajan]|uniref:UPF0496 protein At3g19330 n=1 Tax=Cajanus cajan TaxID=3821 RepID=UPI00098D93EC|nr:UPF0496 protein At3g19330 [Cajanus cajan]